MAWASLSEIGFEVFAPLCVKLILRHKKYVQSLQPLFPRYVFAHGGTHTTSVHRLKGITGFAGPSLKQSLVDDRIINAIKERSDERGVVVIKNDEIESGQEVKILTGPFAGLNAVFSEADDRKRSFILLNLMGKSHRIRVLNTHIQASA